MANNPLDDIQQQVTSGDVQSVHPDQVFMDYDKNPDPTALTINNQPKSSALDAFNAVTEQNLYSSFRGAANWMARQFIYQPGYNPYKDPQLAARGNAFTLQYQDGLKDIANPADMANSLKAIDHNNELSDIIGQHPKIAFVSGILASAPEMLAFAMPFAAQASFSKQVIASTAIGAAFGGADTLGQQQYDPTVSDQDISDNFKTGALLGTAIPIFFHGTSALVNYANMRAMAGIVDKPINLAEHNQFSVLSHDQSLGAAEAPRTLTPEGEKAFVPDNIGGKIYTKLQNAESILSPEQEVRTQSPSDHMQQWVNETYLTGLTLNKNLEGVASQNKLLTNIEASTANTQYRFSNGIGDIHNEALASGDFNGNINDFLKQSVDDYMTGSKTKGGDFVKNHFNQQAKELNDLKIPEDGKILSEDGSYFPQTLDHDKLAKNYSAFKQIVQNKLGDEQNLAEGRANELLRQTTEKNLDKISEEHPDFDPYKFEELPHQERANFLEPYMSKDTKADLQPSLGILNNADKEGNIEVRRDALMNKLLNPDSAPKFSNDTPRELREKTINFSYSEVKDFLPDNYVNTISRYNRDIAVQKEIAAQHPEARFNGTEPVTSKNYVDYHQRKVADDYSKLIDNAPSDAAREKLIKRAARDKEIIQTTHDIITKSYDKPTSRALQTVNKFSRIILQVQSLMHMGMATFANFSDFSDNFGTRNALWLGKDVGQTLENISKIKLSKEDLEFMHIHMSEDSPFNSAHQFLGTDNLDTMSKVEKGLEAASKPFFKYNGFNYLVNKMRSIAAGRTVDKVVKAMSDMNAGLLDPGSKVYNDLHRIGFDSSNMSKYLNEFQQHGTIREGIRGTKFAFANVSEWTPSVGLDFTSKILAEVENIAKTKTVGDAPFWTNHAWGRLITQFKSWTLGAMNRQLLPMLQGLGMGTEYNAMFASRLMSNILLANLGSNITNVLKGRAEDNKYDVKNILYTAFDRGNTFALMAAVSNTMDSVGFGLGSAMGIKDTKQFNREHFLGNLSPTLGLADKGAWDGATALKNILSMKGTKKDWGTLLRLLPGSNYIGIGYMINKLTKKSG